MNTLRPPRKSIDARGGARSSMPTFFCRRVACWSYHLLRLVEEHNKNRGSSGQGQRLEPMIVLIEKAGEIGAHGLSGAVIDPWNWSPTTSPWIARSKPT